MRMSQLWTKTLKEVPGDEVAKNAQLLIRAGYVYKEMAGAYAYLPLGLAVLENIKAIVREEMNAIGSTELVMTTLQRKELWESSGRWDDAAVDVWFKSALQDGTPIGFGWTHEEPIIDMMRHFLKSYKDAPISLYQLQTKLRNELRAKSGIMRGREFIMKDMYSFHASADDLAQYYEQVIAAYRRTYDRLGIGEDTYMTFASGGSFTAFSHEFQTICDAGEDVIYLHREKQLAINEEVIDEAVQELGVAREELEKVKTAEVGNIFNFGAQKTDDMGLYLTGPDGKQASIYLGSYGIGITRVMGVIVEKFADDRGLVWPEAIAPFAVQLVAIGDAGRTQAETLYRQLIERGVAVLYDDREVRPGVKFADAELMGMPYRLTVSDRLQATGQVELTGRRDGETRLLTAEEALAILG